MKTKTLSLLSLSILVLVMFMGVASASTVLTITNTTVIPSTINHGEEITVELNVTYTGVAEEGIDLTWEGVTPDNTEFWTLPTISHLDLEESVLTTFTFSIPQHYSPEIIDAILRLSGGGTEKPDDFEFQIEVNEDKSLSIELTQDLTKTQNGTITITNTGNVDLTNINLEVVSVSPDFSVDFGSITSPLTPGNYEEIEVSSTNIQNLELGDDNTITIRATTDEEAECNTITLTVPVSFCDDCENLGNLRVNNIDFSVEEGFGDDEDYWYPFDEVEVKFDVENNGNWDIENIEIQACLFDVDKSECIMDENDMDLSDDDFDLDEDEDKTIILSFEINPDDLNKGNKYYEIYLSAKGKIDDKDAGEDDGEKTCASDSKEIEIRTDENFIILSDFNYPEIVQCGAEVTISFEAWNIGDNKIDEDEVFISVYNNKLAINELIKVDDDIRALDNEKIEFTFNVPETMDEAWYTIEFTVYDDEDLSDNDIYENSENDEAIFHIYLKVEGSCAVVEPSASVSATLESGGQAGQELVIKAIVTNTGDELANYELNAVGYADWASSADVEPSTIILGAGESKEVLITFNVNKDVSGEKSFDIELVSDAELIVKQPVQVSIEKPSFFPGITGWAISEGNWYLWAIGALNIILVIIIIIVAMRVARK